MVKEGGVTPRMRTEASEVKAVCCKLGNFLDLVKKAYDEVFCFVRVETEEAGRHPIRD